MTAGKYSMDHVALVYNLANFCRFLVTTVSRFGNLIEQHFDLKFAVISFSFLHSLPPFLELDEASFTCWRESTSES